MLVKQISQMDKALELHVLSVLQEHTIPSGATVITKNISKEKGKVELSKVISKELFVLIQVWDQISWLI